MRAIGVNEFGGPEQLRVVDVPEPHPGPGEVRIRVHATPVVPVDAVLRAGSFGRLGGPPPYIPGLEAAGVVSEAGAGVSWRVGDQVMAVTDCGSNAGAYADEVVVPAEWVVRIPKGADFAHACTLPQNGLTARATLDQLGLKPGQTLAITGSAGIVGGYLIQLAKAEGLRVIADASAADEQLVYDLGADEVIRRGGDVANRIRKVVPDGVDGLADCAVQNELVIPAIRDGGRLALLRPWSGRTARGITAQYVSVARTNAAMKIDLLREQVEQGVITLRVAEVLPAEQAAEAHRRL